MTVEEVAKELDRTPGWVRRKYLKSIDGKPPLIEHHQVPPRGKITIYEGALNKFLEKSKQ
jgi:hypothetical protein